MSFSVGNALGRQHTFEKGKHKMSTRTVLASSSKLPVALAIAGVVADGILSFDTPAREVFDWWTQERNHPLVQCASADRSPQK
jgi:CubicO group peptidase (beta-lactamase class C family)